MKKIINKIKNKLLSFKNNCNIHSTAKIMPFTNLYGCEIGENCFVGPFVEIQKNVKIGKNTRISSHTFIPEGVEIGENCFIAHGVMFINDRFDGEVLSENWKLRNTIIEDKVRIGSNATIMPVKIGKNSIIGAGAVVTKNVNKNSVVMGNPAIKLRNL